MKVNEKVSLHDELSFDRRNFARYIMRNGHAIHFRVDNRRGELFLHSSDKFEKQATRSRQRGIYR